MLATRPAVVLRVTNDRGVILLDLTEFDTFEAGAKESDWFNWDVVAPALGILEATGVDQHGLLPETLEKLKAHFCTLTGKRH
jgi:hypothetical protein